MDRQKSHTQRSSNRKQQYQNRRQAVIRAAGQAFRRRGYHNTSLQDIAESLGLTKTALYYYVKNKEEILYECHIKVYDAMDEILSFELPQDQSGLDSLSGAFFKIVSLLTRDGLPLLTDVSSLSGALKKDVLGRRAKIETAITQIVKRGIWDGSIRRGDAAITVYYFMGALNWLNAWYREDGRLSGDEIATQFTAQLRSGIQS